MGKGAQHCETSEPSKAGQDFALNRPQAGKQPDPDASNEFPLLNGSATPPNGSRSPQNALTSKPAVAVYTAPHSSTGRDFLTVALVAGSLVPCFTIFAPIGVILPFYLVFKGMIYALTTYRRSPSLTSLLNCTRLRIILPLTLVESQQC